MRAQVNFPNRKLDDEPSAFDVWFGQTLKNAFEPVIHEPLPPDIMDALPPPAPQN